jgi:type IV pilus biogenesis protein CpaD/CtpE
MTPFPRAVGAVLLAALALALAGCQAQPVGTFDRATFAADRAAGPYTLFFQPDNEALAPGEAERLASYLRTLAPRPGQDILLEVGNSGSAVLDGRRLLTLRRTFAGSRARVRVFVPNESPSPEGVRNTVTVTLVRYDLIVVGCPALDQPGELTTPLPPIGCSNAINLATMAAEKRDLIAPAGALKGSESGVSAAAVLRHREGKVITLPINTSGG